MKERRRLTNLQYKPQALQFNSLFKPRHHRGVWVALQFEHSAFTPPGVELPVPVVLLVWRRTAGLRFVAVTPGTERVARAACVPTVKPGFPVGV
jgi:hypothetical protein